MMELDHRPIPTIIPVMDEFLLSDHFYLVLSAPFVGSFLGVVITRADSELSALGGHSSCPRCSHPLRWRDRVPIVSWMANHAKCSYCRGSLSVFYPAIELAALAIAIWCLILVPGALAWVGCIYGWTLLALAGIDLRSFRLPYRITLPLASVGLLVQSLIGLANLLDGLLGMTIGSSLFILIAWAYRRLRGRDGLGEGDVGLLAAIGAWVGWQGIPAVILIAGLSGLAWVCIHALLRRPLGRTEWLPFGPHLCLGGWITWLYGPIQLG
jgi:leader peptidase (prepilin peptidase)/N-methyltransferase